METSFTEIRSKEIINVLSGRLLGNACDIVFDLRRNCILGLVVPGNKSMLNFFKPCQEIFIPYNSICKIGEDVILVEVVEQNTSKKKNKKEVKIFDMSEEEKSENNENKKQN